MKEIAASLSNLQLEILKLFSADLKNQLSEFYAKNPIENADRVWKEKKLTNEDMDKWLNDD